MQKVIVLNRGKKKKRVEIAAFFLLILMASGALAVTMDEEAARDEGLAAMEPVQRVSVPVQPLIEIEKTWDIEDTHALSGEPLVQDMEFVRGELGYDRESRMFYASVGMNQSEWPELGLSATGAEGMQIAWVDDYAWDSPADAVRQGTAYRLIAWTDTEYEYVNLVFTGLPMMIIHTGNGDKPGSEYGPCLAELTAPDYEPVLSVAQIHTRGGGFEEHEKASYRLEFAKKKEKKYGYKKRSVSLLGMPEDTDWILISNTGDKTLSRNLMGFKIWTLINDDEMPAFNKLQGYLVELCLNDEYEGVYTLQQRVKPERELQKNGFTKEDYSARLILSCGVEQRPVKDVRNYIYNNKDEIWTDLELRHMPEGKTADECFDVYQDFLLLCDRHKALDEETFLKMASEYLDMNHLMRTFLFYEGVIHFFDSIHNNVYIWAVHKDGKLLYYFSPWDMDNAFQLDGEIIESGPVLAIQLLNMNAPGVRSALWEEWKKMRSGPLKDEKIYQLTDEMQSQLDDSGAYVRDQNRWGYENAPGVATIREFLLTHLPEMEMRMADIWPEE